MDLTPVYELRDRLRAGIVAGTALAAEDFRLARALEGIAPLEKASPVFARLAQLTRSALAPDCPDRAVAMLDAITLCDAVLTTQAAVAVPGELSPLPPRKGGRAVTDLPYSVAAPLVEALTTSGSGHFSTVQETLANRADLFRDYRVLEAMVKALGASYGELAELVERHLMEQDGAILPLLAEDFDPAGKKEMARRVQVIEAIAGAKWNDWYLEQLPQAKKPVKGALIYALRHDTTNLEQLLELAQKEKGDNRAMALWALARIDTPAVEDFWREKLKEGDVNTLNYLIRTTTPVMTTLTAERFVDALSRIPGPDRPFTEEEAKELDLLFYALMGKTGDAVRDVYHRLAAIGPSLDQRTAARVRMGKKETGPLTFSIVGYAGRSAPFFRTAVNVLERSIHLTADPGLIALGSELHKKYGGLWAAPVLSAALLTKGSSEAVAEGKRLLAAGLLEKLTGRGRQREVLEIAFAGYLARPQFPGQPLAYYADYRDVEVSAGIFYRPTSYIPPAAPLDGWWCDLFMQCHMDGYLSLMADPVDPDLCQKISKYFYDRVRMGSVDTHLRTAVLTMKECGWTQWKGLLSSYAKHTSRQVSYWDIRNVLMCCPITDRERGEELLAVYRIGKFRPDKAIERQIEQWLGESI